MDKLQTAPQIVTVGWIGLLKGNRTLSSGRKIKRSMLFRMALQAVIPLDLSRKQRGAYMHQLRPSDPEIPIHKTIDQPDQHHPEDPCRMEACVKCTCRLTTSDCCVACVLRFQGISRGRIPSKASKWCIVTIVNHLHSWQTAAFCPSAEPTL